ncbi:MAG: signal peptidase [Pseudonocardiales bacterium]|jgi:lipoprotein signal peptidase|nr:signal peptidase [Pseudonocardiales bacterium]
MHRKGQSGSDPGLWLLARSIVGSTDRLGRRFILLTLMAGIVVLDQGFKWWGWRHLTDARINDGGDILVGTTVNGWYADPVTGALLDLLSFGLLCVAVSILLRRRNSVTVVITGSLMVGGWTSNLLDRLVAHYWTAPGSVRGVVDFIPIGPHYYNVADFFIISGTPLFLVAVSAASLQRWVVKSPTVTEPLPPRTHRRRSVRASLWALATGATLSAVVGIGAANYGGATTPLAAANMAHPVSIAPSSGRAVEIR